MSLGIEKVSFEMAKKEKYQNIGQIVHYDGIKRSREIQKWTFSR